jgi:hypothetical protein
MGANSPGSGAPGRSDARTDSTKVKITEATDKRELGKAVGATIVHPLSSVLATRDCSFDARGAVSVTSPAHRYSCVALRNLNGP